MTSVLVVDDMAVFREPIAAVLKMRGFETHVASDGVEALRIVHANKIDIMLLDVAMPGMNGIEVIERLQQQVDLKRRPRVMLLTAVAEKDYVLRAGRLGVRDYLLKSHFSLEELIHRIKRLLEQSETQTPDAPGHAKGENDAATAESQPGTGTTDDGGDDGENDAVHLNSDDPADQLRMVKPLLRKSEVFERLEECELKAMSPTVQKLITLTGNAGASIDQISRTVKQDHSLAVKLLKLANSSVYTRGEPVEQIDKAVMRIGMSQLRQEVLNISVVDCFSRVHITEDVDAGQFWEHAIATGLIAAEIARERSEAEAESAFTMGLVHDVGRVMFAQQMPEEYAEVVRVAKELNIPLERVESRLLRLNHADCLDRLLHKWKFPKHLIDPIVFHHLSLGNIRRMTPHRVEETVTLALADRLCHALLIGKSGNDTLYATIDMCKALKVRPETLRKIEAEIAGQAESLKLALLAAGSVGGWNDARTSMRATVHKQFHPVYIGLDEVTDSVRMLCDVLRSEEIASDDPPTLAVMHMTDARERMRLAQMLEEADRSVGGGPLPLLIVSSNGKLTLEGRIVDQRAVELLPIPVTLRSFIQVVNDLLDGKSGMRQAA